jgi:hypothetical protein
MRYLLNTGVQAERVVAKISAPSHVSGFFDLTFSGDKIVTKKFPILK